MKLVMIESPYAGDLDGNMKYGRECVADSIGRGEAPFASHLFYTQEGVLRDGIPEERQRGIQAGYEWGMKADIIAFYIDRGLSHGMKEALEFYTKAGKRIDIRSLR